MLSSEVFSTYGPQKQAEIITRLMDLFKSNERGYGVGEVRGAKFNEDKNKWIPGNIHLEKKKATEAEWWAHLAGERFLGLGPILDDNTVWYAVLDVDKLEGDISYEFDYSEQMGKITRSKIPLVVFKTKSGGLRPTLFFTEPIEAELVIRRMKQIAAHLGYAGCEIFPKQTKLDVSNGDFASWIFMPFGPEADMFPEQCCMNESGNAMGLDDSITYAMNKRISREQFLHLFVEEEKAKANGKANGKRKPSGRWSQDETYDLTIRTTFWGGPICMWAIAHSRCRANQNNFLLSVAIFLKKKYPDNWEEPLGWVNMNVLEPAGNMDKLQDIIKRLKTKDYEYGCNDEPMHSHCNPDACRRMPFGVGAGKGGVDHFELGITIVNRIPRIYIINVGEERMRLDSHAFLTQQKYKEMCMDHGVSFPFSMSRNDWETVVRKNIEEATIVEPSEILKTSVSELETLELYLGTQIPNMVRRLGDEYLSGGGDNDGDPVRVREKETRIYFKWKWLKLYCEKRNMGDRNIDKMRMFIDSKAMYHGKTESRGRWFRCVYSVDFDLFNEDIVAKWMHPDKEEPDDV